MISTPTKLLLAVILLLFSNNSFGQKHKLDSVKLEFEGFDTETVYDVSCDAFDYNFVRSKEVKVVKRRQILSELVSLKKDFKQVKSKSFDVRGRITYYKGSKSEKYCFDEFGVFCKDGKMYHNKKLLMAISDNLYSNHPQYLDTLRYHE